MVTVQEKIDQVNKDFDEMVGGWKKNLDKKGAKIMYEALPEIYRIIYVNTLGYGGAGKSALGWCLNGRDPLKSRFNTSVINEPFFPEMDHLGKTALTVSYAGEERLIEKPVLHYTVQPGQKDYMTVSIGRVHTTRTWVLVGDGLDEKGAPSIEALKKHFLTAKEHYNIDMGLPPKGAAPTNLCDMVVYAVTKIEGDEATPTPVAKAFEQGGWDAARAKAAELWPAQAIYDTTELLGPVVYVSAFQGYAKSPADRGWGLNEYLAEIFRINVHNQKKLLVDTCKDLSDEGLVSIAKVIPEARQAVGKGLGVVITKLSDKKS